MWGWILVISLLGFFAFYLTIQLGQIDRIVKVMDPAVFSSEQFSVLKSSLERSTDRLRTEILWMTGIGVMFILIGGMYTYNLVVKPLRKLVQFAEEGQTELPEIKTNNEIKQLMTVLIEKDDRPVLVPYNYSNN